MMQYVKYKKVITIAKETARQKSKKTSTIKQIANIEIIAINISHRSLVRYL